MSASLRERFKQAYRDSPDQPLIRFIGKQGASESFTTAEFFEASAKRAHALAAQGIAAGDLVAIVLPTSSEQVLSFFGAILLGAIPCMLAPPNPRMASEVFARKLQGMLSEKAFALIIAEAKTEEFLRQALNTTETKVIASLKISEDANLGALLSIERNQEAPLFLQHSSGTTGVPKAVMISEGQLLSQIDAYRKAMQITHNDRIVSWLPLYHDMGMIASLWCGILWGLPTTHMNNFAWALKPSILLKAVSDEHATLCWLPNFAFSFMAANVSEEEQADLDLSSMRAWVSCSEPIFQSSFDAFAKRFARNGVHQDQFAASYAMAENVFAVTQTPLGMPPRTICIDREALSKGQVRILERGDSSGRTLVSSGSLVDGIELWLRDKEGNLHTKEDRVGELVIGGECVIEGYFANPDATKAAISEGRYTSGDIGFIHQGELFVIGRTNDMLIIGGRNLDPSEVELCVSNVDGVHAGRVACLGIANIDSGTEEMHLIVECEEDVDVNKLKQAIRMQVAKNTSHQVRHIHSVEKGWLVKSSAGKIARKECKAKLISTTLNQKSP